MITGSPNMALYIAPDSINKFIKKIDSKVIDHQEKTGL